MQNGAWLPLLSGDMLLAADVGRDRVCAIGYDFWEGFVISRTRVGAWRQQQTKGL